MNKKLVISVRPDSKTMSLSNLNSRTQILGGEEYRVFPAVMLVEGVHHGIGSDPVYYGPEILESTASLWENHPVTIGHPVSNGQHVLCDHNGEIAGIYQVGIIRNSRWEDGKLKAELWMNVKWSQERAPGLLNELETRNDIEVSTGLRAAVDGEPGTWSNEDHAGSIVSIAPDHLAILPNSTGACSYSDGCGIRYNQSQKQNSQPIFCEEDLMGRISLMREYVDSLDKYGTISEGNYLRAVYSNSFVYLKEIRSEGNTPQRVFYRQSYSMGSGGNLEVQGDPVVVRESIEYNEKPLDTEDPSVNINSTGGKQMKGKGKGKFCCPERVNAIIANENSSFTEDDREFLEGFTEEQLDKVESLMNMADTGDEGDAPDDTQIQNQSQPDDLQSWLQTCPPQVMALVNSGLKELDAKRNSIIGQILGNENNRFEDAELRAMDVTTLESIASLIPKPAPEPQATYFGQPPVHNQGEQKEEPYVMTSLSSVFNKKKTDE